MKNKNNLDIEYSKVIKDNPDKKFVMYLRNHANDIAEENFKNILSSTYGEFKELSEQRLTIFVVLGNKVQEFIDDLNTSGTNMYLSFIQSEDELLNSR